MPVVIHLVSEIVYLHEYEIVRPASEGVSPLSMNETDHVFPKANTKEPEVATPENHLGCYTISASKYFCTEAKR